MPLIYGNHVVRPGNGRIAGMSLPQLAEYEQTLWNWMVKTKDEKFVAELNAVYREVEWRAQEREWRRAAHSIQRP